MGGLVQAAVAGTAPKFIVPLLNRTALFCFQIMLCNPCCLVGYTIVSWRFFNERIYEEEIYLLNFFGEDYLDYQRRVPTGLPFITGYRGQL